MESARKVINTFLKTKYSPNELKGELFKAGEAAKEEGWTFMDASFQLGGKALKSIFVGSIALQQGGSTVPDPRLVHQGGSETGAECLSDMPGFDHPDPSNAFLI